MGEARASTARSLRKSRALGCLLAPVTPITSPPPAPIAVRPAITANREAATVTQWAAVATLVGEITAPEQMNLPSSRIATVKP